MMNKFFTLFFACCLFFACSEKRTENTLTDTELLALPFDSIVAKAKGSTLNLVMWKGDPYINQYMDRFVVPKMKALYGIDVRISEGQGAGLAQTLLAEKEAGKKTSEIDVVWINGETFYQLRQIDGLFGPFTEKLPNSQYIDFKNPFIGTDFQNPVEGYECPWGNVQEAIIYNSEKVANPPKNRAELADFVKKNKGKFTISNEFTGMTFLKALLSDFAGGKEALSGKFDEAKYKKHSAELWQYLNEIKPYFWKEGKTYPENLASMHQLFANGELWFTMSNNDGEVDNKVLQGLFPKTSRSYVPDFGTIQNSHYKGIIKNAPNKAAAMVYCNFIISPEAQLEKFRPSVWGDGTVLSMGKLPETERQKFIALPERQYSPNRKEIQPKAIMEPAPEYMIHLFDDFRKQVIEK